MACYIQPPKTEALIVSNKSDVHDHPTVYLNNTPIKEVKFHKHLGITLAHNLRWNKHIEILSTSCYKKLDLMKGLKFKLDRKSLETIFKSFILPCLDYGDILYSGTYDSDLNKLDKIQVEAMKIVTGATARSNIQLLFEETDWPSLASRRRTHVLCLFYKIVNNLAPSLLIDTFNSLTIPERPYQLRGNNITVPHTRTESYRRSFFPEAIRQWNLLHPSVRSTQPLI